MPTTLGKPTTTIYDACAAISPITPSMWPPDSKSEGGPHIHNRDVDTAETASFDRRKSLGPRPSTILHAWLPEITSCVLGLLSFVAIIIILRIFDGKKQPELALGFTVNSILQYLASFTKLCFLFPVTEAVCQLRWLWFVSKPRPLHDFQLYDEATRGGVGIFKLLFRLKGILKSPLLWLASVLIISAVFTSAVTQQVVLINSELTASTDGPTSALAPRASFFSRWDGTKFNLEPNDALDLEQKILESAYLRPTSPVRLLDPSCPSADCIYPRFGTLGVCASTIPITNATAPQLISQLTAATIATVNNGSLANLDERSYLASVAILRAPSTLFPTNATTTALADAMLIYTAEPIEPRLMQPGDLRFIEILLYMCVKGYDTTVAAGEKNTTERSAIAKINSLSQPRGSDNANFTSLNAAWNAEKFDLIPQVACKPGVGGVSIGLAAPAKDMYTYGADLCTALMTSSAIIKFLPGFIALREGDKTVAGGRVAGMLLPALGVALYGEFSAGVTPGEEQQLGNVRGIVRNVADGLTNMLRSKGATYTNSMGFVQGTTLRETPVVRVRWAWLALLAAQLVLTMVFLGVTVMLTHKDGAQVIKSSMLASMCALDQEVRGRLSPASGVAELTEAALHAKVKLKREDSLRLVDAS